jgi:cellulose synthase/poly-beta-1,6-N-acetylglucosamine synthase-like glycosyltransferase
MTFLEGLFWVSVFSVLYSYFIYPAILFLAVYRRTDLVFSEVTSVAPLLTVVIAARNESSRLGAKLDDVLAQGYPRDRLQVLVVSDGSTDDTARIARSYAASGVECIELEERLGKEMAQARGIAASNCRFVVFTDVATRIGGKGLLGMVGALATPGIGAVSSEDRFVSEEGKPAGEGLYVRYEMWLRRLESRAAGLVGLSGSLFGVRRELCDEWPTDVPSDLVVALRCARQGLRAATLPEVFGLYPDLKNESAEFGRKYRTAIRGMAGLASATEILNVRRYGLFAFQAWSHKVLRWAAPWFMLAALGLNFALLDRGGIYPVLLALQIGGYGVAAAAAAAPALRKAALVRVIYYFVLSNLALAFAFVGFVRGRRVVQWEPSVR